MRRAFLNVLSVSILGLTAAASASTITAGTYSLTDTYVAGYSLSGDITFNASGLVTAADIIFDDAAVGDPTLTNVTSTGSGGYNPVADYAYIGGADGQVDLEYLDTLTPAGDIELCIDNESCNAYQGSYAQVYSPSLRSNLTSGTIDPVAGKVTAPEPSSLALLGTGILGFAILLRRRFRRS